MADDKRTALISINIDNGAAIKKVADLMKKINRVIQIPMNAGGNIRRQEDVKKILYAGAKKAIVDIAKANDADLVEEVSKRFGKEKIAVSLKDFDKLYKALKDDYVILFRAHYFVSNGFDFMSLLVVHVLFDVDAGYVFLSLNVACYQ